jgi:hypothetical protein
MARNWFKDGQLDTAALDELEANLKAVTDKTGGLLDISLGKGLVWAFRCGHSKLLYPSDYAKEWGRLYGIGLGPDVCSEALDSEYMQDLPSMGDQVRRITQIMHPMHVTRAQMDLVSVTPQEWEQRTTVLDQEDADYQERVPILLTKQLQKSPAMKALYAQWETRNGPLNLQTRKGA